MCFARKWSAQAALFQAAARKLLSASCCTQVLCASCSAQVLPELWGMYFAYYLWRALRVLRLCLKAAIFNPELPESNPRLRDCESRSANHETASKGHFASNKIARRHSESTISAEGRAGTAKNRVLAPRPHRSPQRSRGHAQKNAKTTRVFAPRPRRSPQKVARAYQKTQTNSSFCTSTTPISAESRGYVKKHKKPRVFAPRPRRSPQRVAFPIVGNIPTPRLKRDS